jgi:protein gp37
MARNSKIEWTDDTWNPVTGCTKVSAGCDHCYAETFAERFRGKVFRNGKPNYFFNGFDLTLRPHKLDDPLHWKKPRAVFGNSMSDLFHKDIEVLEPGYTARVFTTMEKADRHIFQVLTKRSSLMRDFLLHRYGDRGVPRHIWCGVSIEDTKSLVRLKHLREAPVGVRFLSLEPLLESLGTLDLDGIDWVIAGGESGDPCRPMDLGWAREIRDQCAEQGVAFFMKQLGGHPDKRDDLEQFPDDLRVRQFPKVRERGTANG